MNNSIVSIYYIGKHLKEVNLYIQKIVTYSLKICFEKFLGSWSGC